MTITNFLNGIMGGEWEYQNSPNRQWTCKELGLYMTPKACPASRFDGDDTFFTRYYVYRIADNSYHGEVYPL